MPLTAYSGSSHWLIHSNNPRSVHQLGMLPSFLDENSAVSAKEQLHAAYAHGGGWQHFKGFKLTGARGVIYQIEYPGDPPLRELARCSMLMTDELVLLFPYSWVAVVEPDNGNKFEICRMD